MKGLWSNHVSTARRLAEYIMRNHFSLEKMQVNTPDDADFRLTAGRETQADGCVIYRSGMDPKIRRNFEVFSPATSSPPSPSISPRQEFSTCALHRLVLQQNSGAAPETCRRGGGNLTVTWSCVR
jgi:hypothetical protein